MGGIVAAFFIGLGVGTGSDEPAQEVVRQPTAVASATIAATETPTATPEPTATSTDTPEPTPTETLVRASPTPVATVSSVEVYKLWYDANGFPDAAYPQVLDFVDVACESLRDGASAEEVLLVVVLATDPSLHEMMGTVLGAGIQAFCPDQAYKLD